MIAETRGSHARRLTCTGLPNGIGWGRVPFAPFSEMGQKERVPNRPSPGRCLYTFNATRPMMGPNSVLSRTNLHQMRGADMEYDATGSAAAGRAPAPHKNRAGGMRPPALLPLDARATRLTYPGSGTAPCGARPPWSPAAARASTSRSQAGSACGTGNPRGCSRGSAGRPQAARAPS